MHRPELRFRLNGVVIPEIRVQRALVQGRPVGPLEIAVCDPWIGWFALDDNAHFPDRRLSRFDLQFRDETALGKVDPLIRRMDASKGWQRVSPRKLMKLLQRLGYIDFDELRQQRSDI